MTTTHETGDAAAEVAQQAQDRLEHIRSLQRVMEGEGLEFSNDELLALGVGYGIPGELSDEQLREMAQEALQELPLCVESTICFEVVLGTGGPDDRLIFECDDLPQATREAGEPQWETPPRTPRYAIRRVLYRYSWTGSAEVELTGDDREAAEALAYQVVPELIG